MRTGEAVESVARTPLVRCQWCGSYTSSCADLPQVSLFQLPRWSDRAGISRFLLPASACENWIIPAASWCSWNILSPFARTHTSFIFLPTSQLVELDLGWCKPARPPTATDTLWNNYNDPTNPQIPPSQHRQCAVWGKNLMRTYSLRGMVMWRRRMRERDGSDGREEGGWKETRRGQYNDEKGCMAGSNFSAVIRNSGVLLFGRTNQSSGYFHPWLCS